MSLALKMRLQTATKSLLADKQVSYILQAVTGDENKPWSKFTPSGTLSFCVTNPDCPDLEGGDYLATLTRL